ncbi:armadillo-type protein [Mycena pura]|uniref:Vacuolar protein 8 n=1 Tax=Mycena pura TaxID=153505 RepID=A0AAD6V7S1_9AGAR|nr:armadillo-type protein [Mycena pura]
MPPLSRSQTIPSLHSWWSDSNTPGATVNLHALSKPLMRVLYHWQAREFIRINQGVRLSKDTMDIFLSYLHYKHVSVATRTLVMEELNTRAKTTSAEDASVIVELLKRDAVLTSLLQSPTSSVKTLACDLLRNLMMQDLLVKASTSLHWTGSKDLTHSHSDGDPKVRRSAMFALSGISQWPEGAEAVVDAKAHEHAMALFKSPDAGIRASTCYMLGNLASHERTWAAALSINPCFQLVPLLSDQDIQVRGYAAFALANLSRWLQGAQSVVDAKALKHTLVLLHSTDAKAQSNACLMLGHLADHKETWPAILGIDPCWHLVYLLRLTQSHSNQDVQVCRSATLALANISQWIEGAQSVLDAEAPGYASDLLKSPDPSIRAYTCLMLGNLASYKVTWSGILSPNHCLQLVSLLSNHQDIQVCRYAVLTLANLSQWLKGARSALNAKAPKYALDLLTSADANTRAYTCLMLGNLASHEVTWAAILRTPPDFPASRKGSWPGVLSIIPCLKLASLLDDQNIQVCQFATLALANLSQWFKGAKLVVNAKVPERALTLLNSNDDETRAEACRILGNLADHESTWPVILAINPCWQLVNMLSNIGCCPGNLNESCLQLMSQLSDQDTQVRRYAALALANISQWPKGAESVVDVKAPEHALALLKSPDTGTRAYTCYMLANLADHQETWAAILAIDPCLQLVSLLRNQDIQVYQYAALMLANLTCVPVAALAVTKISNQWLEGAEFVVYAEAPIHAMALLNSNDDKTRAEACRILGNLAWHEVTSGDVLAVNPCFQLVSQLDKKTGVIHFKSDHDIQVCRYAALALANLSLWIQGAKSVVNAKALEYTLALLNCTDAKVQAYACLMLGNLSDHKATWPAVLAINPCLQLVSFLTGDEEPDSYTLTVIKMWKSVNVQHWHWQTSVNSESDMNLRLSQTLVELLRQVLSILSLVSQLIPTGSPHPVAPQQCSLRTH